MIKFRRIRWACHAARLKEGSSVFKMLTGKPLGRPRRRWEGNIRIQIKLLIGSGSSFSLEIL